MAMNKRKKTTVVVAGVTAAVLLLGGTFAWTSISQQAKNESAGIVNVGGRLHDDFNGTNKDVYVENFTDPLNGGQPIYARVKLTEYMEVGQDAGGFGDDTNSDGKVTAVPVIEGTDINDVDTWETHIPSTSCAICATEGTCAIHDHWEWEMGGQTTFMPTFNKDKDSLEPDINGTYAGTNADDKIYYDDYVEYTTDNTADGVGVDIAEADTEAYDGKIYSVVGTEYYDDDTDTEDNGGTRQVADVTHTAKETADGTVITMQQWIDDYDKAPGNYWVYDEDGWAYWANPIMPGEATGLLLSNINMTKNPGEKCYYAINVVGQFATVGDWEYFDGELNQNVMDLLKAASENVPTVTVSNDSDTMSVERGETVNFTANVSVNGANVYAATDFEWSVLDDSMKEITEGTIITDGVLTVGEKETSKTLTVVAKAKEYLGAAGMSSVTVKLPEIPDEITAIADVEAGSTTTITIDNQEWFVLAKENGQALLLAKTPVQMVYYAVDTTVDNFLEVNKELNNNSWENSDVRTYLNGEYLAGLPMLSQYVQTTTLMTYDTVSYQDYETEDQVFILSYADFADVQYSEYTSSYGWDQERAFDGLVSADIRNALGGSFATRTEYIDIGDEEDRNFNALAFVSGGYFDMQYTFYEAQFYPAMWVKYDANADINM